jgi:16S rRNA U1498 N3-methylase RsmE
MFIPRTLSVRARPYIREASILPRLINNQTTVRHYHPTAGLYLNRIFVEKSEVCVDEETVILKSPDDRFQHIDSILKIQENDMIKMGVIDCGVTDTATVVEKTDDSVTINIGSVNNLTVTPKPSIDIILAFPRPARLTWLFPVISSLGVGRISLIRAAKTEKGYMGKDV